MIVLTQRQLLLCWLASIDAQDDAADKRTTAGDDRCASLPHSERAIYTHAYCNALAAIQAGQGVHLACTAAEDALRELATPAGIP